MIGQIVTHTRFGRGEVVGFEPPRIQVRFGDAGVKTFAYPQAVGRFLAFEDEGAAARAREDLERAGQSAVEDICAQVEARRRVEEELDRRRLEALHEKRVTAARRAAARTAQAREARSARRQEKVNEAPAGEE